MKETLLEGVLAPIEKWENATDKAKRLEQALWKAVEQKNDEIARLRAFLEGSDPET